MKYLVLAILLVAGSVHAYTVTMNFAARIGVNDTIRINDTDYNATSFAFNSVRYAAINSSSTLAAIVSPYAAAAMINGSYYRGKIDNTLIALHLDNSTSDANGINNGTAVGNVSCNSAGKIDGACSFTGGHVNFSALDIEGQKNYTIAVWIKTSDNGGIFSQSDGTANHLIALQIIGSVARFATFEGGAGNIDDSLAINDGAWHHIAAAKNGTSGTLYVDGAAKATGLVALVSSTTDARIGTLYNGTSAFPGDIDEFLAFNRTLSALEIRELYEHNPHYTLMQLTGSRLLITATNGTYGDVDGKLTMLSSNGIVSATFGRFAAYTPAAFRMFLRLEYSDTDIDNKIEWSGIGRLVIRNTGLNSAGLPIVRLELIR